MEFFRGKKTIRIHPSVVFNILNHYTRRDVDRDERVFGTLLGRDKETSIEVSHSFPDLNLENEDEDEEVPKIDPDGVSNKRFTQLYREFSPKRAPVGFYHVANELSEDDETLRNFYINTSRNAKRDLLLIHVDPYFESDLKMYLITPVFLGSQEIKVNFIPAEWSYVLTQHEHLAMRMLMDKQENLGDIDYLSQFKASCRRVIELFKENKEYIQGVLDGSIEADYEFASELYNTLSLLEVNVNELNLQSNFEEKVQDLLVITYLAKFAKVQIQVFEKLLLKKPKPPKKRMDRKPRQMKKGDYEKKPYEKKPYEKKPYEKKPYEKKPYEKRNYGKPYEKRYEKRNYGKPYEKRSYDRKPYGKRNYDRKAY